MRPTLKEERPVVSIANELASLLSTVRIPGDFYTHGTTDLYLPRLEVQGVGPIALPLLPAQAEQLIAVAEQAPYGRGTETLIDTQVRRTWQIAANRVCIQGGKWAQTLDAIVAQVTAGLGVTTAVVPELYKLLVYDVGSFFVSHRDTEKAPGMFATLIIALPSDHCGGELLVRHQDREARLTVSSPDPAQAAFVAFYADCVHQVLPVTSGYRLVLVYNLLRQEPGKLPKPPCYETETAQIRALLRQWCAAKERGNDASPEKLVYPLEHAYTQAELSFQALKGPDAAAANVLAAAALQTHCDIHVALLSIQESGAAHYTGQGDYHSHRDSRDEDEFEIIEISDRSATLSNWHRPDGGSAALGVFPFDETELCPSHALDDWEPDEQYFHEATGNEGASFDRAYCRAALVLWPKQRRLAVISQAGLAVALPCLAEMHSQWAASGKGQESALWQEAHELSRHIVLNWPKAVRQHNFENNDVAQVLTLLQQLHDTEHIDAVLQDICAAGVYGRSDNHAVLNAAALLPPQRSGELIERIVQANASLNFGACADLLARAAAATPAGHARNDLLPAARALVEALPGNPARPAKPEWAWRTPPIDSDFIVELITALGSIDAALADSVVDQVLAWPRAYGLDAIVLPVVLRLNEQDVTASLSAVARLRAACAAHLRARIAEPLAPPTDWTRASTLDCRCPSCTELSRFLARADQPTWTVKAVEIQRRHLTESIRRNRCDLDVATDRKGRPYSLVCTKNQNSHDRLAQQRRHDLTALSRLDPNQAG